MFDIYLQFLQDIFDALFAILNEGAEQYGNLVFQALVSGNILLSSVGLISQLLEHCTVITGAMTSNP